MNHQDQMQAAVITVPGTVELREVPQPHAGPGEVCLRLHAAGVCGTDLHLLHGHFGAVLPLIAGHEVSGIIDEVGAGVRHLREGDLVTLDPNLWCGECWACRRGLFQHCEFHGALGATRSGGFAEWMVAPAQNVFSAAGLSADQATLAEPLACVAWGMRRLRPPAGASAVVFSAGPIGLLLMQGLLASGCTEVTVVDPVQGRLKLASELGAARTFLPHARLHEELLDHKPHGYDVSAEATGVPDVVQNLPALTAIGGQVLVFGVAREDARVQISPYELFLRDLTVLGSYSLNGTVPLALNMKAHPGLAGAQKVFIQPHAVDPAQEA